MGKPQPKIVTVKLSDHVLDGALAAAGDHASARMTTLKWQTCALVLLYLVAFLESRSPLSETELKDGHVATLYRQAAACLTAPVTATAASQPKYMPTDRTHGKKGDSGKQEGDGEKGGTGR